ncbi:MAG: hypothetical protein ACXABO_15920 [Promethearchaeota archaeon]
MSSNRGSLDCFNILIAASTTADFDPNSSLYCCRISNDSFEIVA